LHCKIRSYSNQTSEYSTVVEADTMKTSTKIFLSVTSVLVVCGIFATLFVLVLLRADEDTEIVSGFGSKIAVVELVGEITSSTNIVKQFKKYREDNSIKAIVFRVESPGGGVAASQEIYEEVRKTREAGMPVVVSMGSVAASGGYYVSCGASKVVANPGTLTGSIGVIAQFVRLDPLLGKIGVEMTTIKSGKFKDVGNPFREMSKEERAYFQRLMDDVYLQFMTVVEKERRISRDSVRLIADGRVYTGFEAFNIGLVDTLGTYEDAIAIAAKMAGIKGKPSIVREKKRKISIFDLLFDGSVLTSLFDVKEDFANQPILQYKMVPGL
jgi:protease-4